MKTQTITKLTGIGSTSGRKSWAQCQAAIMMRSAVAFATLSAGHYFGNLMHSTEVDSLVLQCRYVVRPAELAGSKLSNARLRSRHRLPFIPRTQCDSNRDCLILHPLLPFAHDQSLHERRNQVVLLTLKTVIDCEL